VTAERAGSLKAGKGGFVIPRRGDGGADGMLDSPRVAPSPRGGDTAARSTPAAAAAAAASQPGAKRRRLDSQASTPRSATAAAAACAAQRGWEDAAAAAPPGPPRRGAIIPKVGQQMGAPAAHDRHFPTTFCLDNLPACIDTPALREALEGLGFQGLRVRPAACSTVPGSFPAASFAPGPSRRRPRPPTAAQGHASLCSTLACTVRPPCNLKRVCRR
jgi:pyruvate/2-oxoglutarate dehydrogenase complex dihydrolipoamide acyltransferase (E2) component